LVERGASGVGASWRASSLRLGPNLCGVRHLRDAHREDKLSRVANAKADLGSHDARPCHHPLHPYAHPSSTRHWFLRRFSLTASPFFIVLLLIQPGFYSTLSQHPLFPGAPNPSLCSAHIPILIYHLMFAFDAQHTSRQLIFSPSLCASPQFNSYFATRHSSRCYASWLKFDVYPAAWYSSSARELYLFARHPSRHRVSRPTVSIDSSPWSLFSHYINSHDHYPFNRMCSFCHFAPMSLLCINLIPSYICTSLIRRRLAQFVHPDTRHPSHFMRVTLCARCSHPHSRSHPSLVTGGISQGV
jgi:hypothetical protein